MATPLLTAKGRTRKCRERRRGYTHEWDLSTDRVPGKRGDTETFYAQISDDTFTFRDRGLFADRKVTGAAIAEARGAHPVAIL